MVLSKKKRCARERVFYRYYTGIIYRNHLHLSPISYCIYIIIHVLYTLCAVDVITIIIVIMLIPFDRNVFEWSTCNYTCTDVLDVTQTPTKSNQP